MTYTRTRLTDPVTALNAEFDAVKAETDALGARKTIAVRVPLPALGVSPAVADVAVTWPVAFADTNYTVVATVEENATTGNSGALVRKVNTRAVDGCVIRVANHNATVALTAGQAILHVIATHD